MAYKFQSLFYWKYLSDDFCTSIISGAWLCFNPCFIGSIFQTLHSYSLSILYVSGFNPCFIGSIFQTLLLRPFRLNSLRFNPCFIGSIFQTGWPFCVLAHQTRFQSLFYWKYLSDPCSFLCPAPKFNCFNPCFIGSIFQTGFINTYRIEARMFQSLFYWKYLSDGYEDFHFALLFLVSILVLLEVSFRQRQRWLRRNNYWLCFNPCFIGSIFQTVITTSATAHWIVFQSLFYWKYLSDLKAEGDEFDKMWSFNPCFIGSIFQTNDGDEDSNAVFKFQSLFYWKYLSDLSERNQWSADKEFQSLFYWKYLSDTGSVP